MSAPENRTLQTMLDEKFGSSNGYAIQDTSPSGSEAVVYYATQRSDGREVALRYSLNNSEPVHQLFRKQADTWLNHDCPPVLHHVVRAFAYFSLKGAPILVMERALENLEHRYEHGEVPRENDTRIQLAMDALRGASEVYSIVLDPNEYTLIYEEKPPTGPLRAVHRDIKSTNFLLFLDENGRLRGKISDLGLMGFAGHVSSVKGTAAWRPPEGFKKFGSEGSVAPVSPQQDVYMLGLLYAKILLNRMPFEDFKENRFSRDWEVRLAERKATFCPSEVVFPDDLQQFAYPFYRATQTDAANRFPNVEVFRDAVLHVVKNKTSADPYVQHADRLGRIIATADVLSAGDRQKAKDHLAHMELSVLKRVHTDFSAWEKRLSERLSKDEKTQKEHEERRKREQHVHLVERLETIISRDAFLNREDVSSIDVILTEMRRIQAKKVTPIAQYEQRVSQRYAKDATFIAEVVQEQLSDILKKVTHTPVPPETIERLSRVYTGALHDEVRPKPVQTQVLVQRKTMLSPVRSRFLQDYRLAEEQDAKVVQLQHVLEARIREKSGWGLQRQRMIEKKATLVSTFSETLDSMTAWYRNFGDIIANNWEG